MYGINPLEYIELIFLICKYVLKIYFFLLGENYM